MAAMIDMKALATQITHAQAEVGGDSKGILSIGTRMRLWEATIDAHQTEASYRRRTYLDMLCVRKVLYIWEQAFRGRPDINEMLSLAVSLAENQVDTDDAKRSAFHFFQSLGDEATNPENDKAIFAANAAQHMVISACHRDPYYVIDEELEDDDELLPDSLDCSYACARAVAGGMNWRPADEVDVEARRAFWMRHLNNAIPSVLDS
jgi:hypothetical protein